MSFRFKSLYSRFYFFCFPHAATWVWLFFIYKRIFSQLSLSSTPILPLLNADNEVLGVSHPHPCDKKERYPKVSNPNNVNHVIWMVCMQIQTQNIMVQPSNQLQYE